MIRLAKKILRFFLIFLGLLLGAIFVFFFLFGAPKENNIRWGVNFSQKHAVNLGLNWKETYLALIDDLRVKNLKVALHWDIIEPENDKYYFPDFDWQVGHAQTRDAKMTVVIGMKTSRWPECHIPQWAKKLSKEEQQAEILDMLEEVVNTYKGIGLIERWQVENEPFFPFGECPWADEEFLAKEIALVKQLDPDRPIVITDSGEGSFWTAAARHGDIVGTTMYRKVWVQQLGFYFTYPLPPTFYWRKAQFIKKFYGKEVIGAELQAEPWGPKLLYDISLEEMGKTMTPERFQKNIAFAKKTGLKEHDLWGAEWWYWMKAKHNDSSYWEEARKLFVP